MDEWPAASCGDEQKSQAGALTEIFMGEFSGEKEGAQRLTPSPLQ
jgi:hypothetical protein